MRVTLLGFAALLPITILADDQVPLSAKAAGWFDKAKAFVSAPVESTASAIASKAVTRINIRNYERILTPSKPPLPDRGEEEWMVYVTGGNKTCYGRCGTIDAKWNESVPLLSALPQSNLHLGSLDCEKEEILCTALSATVPSVFHFLIPSTPAAGQANARTPLHMVPLNISTTTISNITSIPSSSGARYTNYEEYTGLLHPVDGFLAKYGLFKPLGYFLWGLGSTPSWLMMIGISFVSRQIMSKRMANRPGLGAPASGGAAPAGGAPAAAPVPGAQGPASPRGGGGGGKKKR